MNEVMNITFAGICRYRLSLISISPVESKRMDERDLSRTAKVSISGLCMFGYQQALPTCGVQERGKVILTKVAYTQLK